MEGPSIFLAAEQLAPFVGKKIQDVSGNTKIGKERLDNQRVISIFSWGKHLVLQMETFALRVHFLLFGSFEATVEGKKVTGDYPTKNREPRLKLTFENGEILMFSCSLKFLESTDAKRDYDYSIDTMSPLWNEKKALAQMKDYAEEEIGDLLLDQKVFAGVGNIIKNEVLFLVKKLPFTQVKDMKSAQRKDLIKTVQNYVRKFYEWRKQFQLKKHYQIYRKSVCSRCGGKVTRRKTGKRERLSFYCPECQK